MPFVGELRKEPYEVLDRAADFASELGTGETLASGVSVTAINAVTGADTTAQIIAASPVPAISGTLVTFRVQGGNDLEHHTITVRVTTSTGERFEAEIALYVVEG